MQLRVSNLKTELTAPKSYVENSVYTLKKIGVSYDVYIDVSPKLDYVDGAYI